ncbi:MAG: hypothetical protein R3Y33_02575 [Clostridia bacterium]
MIILYIFLGIIAFVLLLTLIPLQIYFTYNENIGLIVKYFFVKIDVIKLLDKKEPEKEETPKEVPKTEEGEKKKNAVLEKIKDFYDRKGFIDFLEFLKELSVAISKGIYGIIKHIKIKYLDIYLKAGGEDASACANQYGQACQIIYPFSALVTALPKAKDIRASVDIDYKSEKTVLIAETAISIMPIFIIKHALSMMIKTIKEIIKK